MYVYMHTYVCNYMYKYIYIYICIYIYIHTNTYIHISGTAMLRREQRHRNIPQSKQQQHILKGTLDPVFVHLTHQ